MMIQNINSIQKVVQKNCDIIDSEYGQNYGLCIYLLKMRDYYRWHKQIPLYQDLNNDEIHKWIADKEAYWDKISGDPLQDIELSGLKYKHHDSSKINKQLNPEGFVYSGGLGYGGIPLFFFAELDRFEKQNGFTILFANKELSRGLFGSPALYLGDTIYIRRESLKHLLWSRFDEWSFGKRKNTMGKALSYYAFESNPQAAINMMTDFEISTLVQHEIGEGLLDKEFGLIWADMILEFAYTKTEILLRAVRDLAVDCMTTLPFLIDEQRTPSIHLFFAGYSDMRKELYPSLYSAYMDWQKSQNFRELIASVEYGKVRWFDVGKKAIEMFEAQGKSAQADLNYFIENLSE